MNLIVIFIVYALRWANEVRHDHALKQLNILATKQDKMAVARLSSTWHSSNWQSHAILAVLTGYLVSTGSDQYVIPWYCVLGLYTLMIGSMRVLILNIGLNILEPKVKWYHLGTSGIDGFFRKIPILYYILVSLILVASTYLIYRV